MKSESRPLINRIRRKGGDLEVGSRVMTPNSRLGTVIRLSKDEQGDYVVVKLDNLSGEFAYDLWDLKKIEEKSD